MMAEIASPRLEGAASSIYGDRLNLDLIWISSGSDLIEVELVFMRGGSSLYELFA